MPDKIETIITAKDETKAALNSATNNLKKYENAHNNAMKKGAKHRTVTRQLRAQFGQLGYQIQDVAVQMQMGTNVMMVLGQQGSQMASVFGSGGAIIGAFIAAGAAITSVLIPDLFAGGKALKEFKTNLEGLRATFNEGLNADTALSGMQKLIDKGLDFEIKDIDKKIKAAEKELNSSMRVLRDAFTTDDVVITLDLLSPFTSGKEKAASIRKERLEDLEAAKRQVIANETLLEVLKQQKKVQAEKKATTQFGGKSAIDAEMKAEQARLDAVGKANKEATKEAKDAAAEKEKLRVKYERFGATVSKTLDPMLAHQERMRELTEARRRDTISLEVFNAATDKSRAAMEAMIDAQDPQLAMLDAISEAVDDVPWSTYTADQLKAVEAIRDAQDPMRAHNRYVEELKVLVKDAGLSEQAFTLAVQASRDALMEKNEVLEESQTLLQEYADEASNVKDSLQEVATGGVRSLENSMLDLAKGTKSAAEAFKSMANSIADDIARMYIKQKITGPIATGLDTMLGGMSNPFSSVAPAPAAGTIGGGVSASRLGRPLSSGSQQSVVVNYSPQVTSLDPRGAAKVLQDNAATIAGVVEATMNRRGRRGPLTA